MTTDKKHLVSVIVPCYNYGRYIEDTLRSVQAQTYVHWECIVVDDGSTDNSAEVVKTVCAADPRVRYIYQANRGLPAARNTGIAHSKGSFLQFLDADDLLQPDKIRASIAYFESHPDVDIVYTELRYFPDGQPDALRYTYSASLFNRPWTLQRSGRGRELLHLLVISSVLMPPMPLLRTGVVQQVGLFSEDLRSCEDWEYWLRCAWLDLTFAHLMAPDTFCLMRLHPNSMTSRRPIMIAAMLEVRARLQRLLIDHPRLQRLNSTFAVNDLIESGIVQIQHENRNNGLLYLRTQASQGRSVRIWLFYLLCLLLPPRRCLQILALLRSAMKHIYYRCRDY